MTKTQTRRCDSAFARSAGTVAIVTCTLGGAEESDAGPEGCCSIPWKLTSPVADSDASIRPPDEPDPELGAVVQRVRVRKGITRAQLARQAEVDESELVALEAGVADTVWTTVDRIASALNTSSAELARLAGAERGQVATCVGRCTREVPAAESDRKRQTSTRMK